MAKAAAVRNIRDDHQKAFLKIFNSLCGRFNRWQVWQDFVMVTAIEISNATDKQNAPERTKTYQTIISKYSDAEQNKFAELLAEVIMGMEQNPDQDFWESCTCSVSWATMHPGNSSPRMTFVGAWWKSPGEATRRQRMPDSFRFRTRPAVRAHC